MATKRQTFDVFVSNLPANITEQSLTSLFNEVGEVCDIRIRDSKRDQASKVAYVRYFFEVDADEAVAKRNGYLFGNNLLDVRKMSKAESNPGSSSGAVQKSVLKFTDGEYKPVRQETPPEEKPANAGGGKEALLAALGAAASERGGQISPPPSIQSSNNSELQLLVCYVKDTTCFIGQRLSDVDQVSEIGKKLASFCPSATPETGLEYHKVYAARYSEDGEWYRCELVRKIDNSVSLVQYIDFGNSEEVQHGSGVVKLGGELASIPGKAVFVRLDGLQSIRREDDPVLYEKALSEVRDLMEDKVVVVQTKTTASLKATTFVTSCRLLQSNRNVFEEVLQRGYAKRVQRRDLSRFGVRMSPPGDDSACPSVAPDAAGRAFTPSRGGGLRPPGHASGYDRGHQQGPSNHAPDRGPDDDHRPLLVGRGLLVARGLPTGPAPMPRGAPWIRPTFPGADPPIRGPRGNYSRDQQMIRNPGEMQFAGSALAVRMALEERAESLQRPGLDAADASASFRQLSEERNQLRAQLEAMDARIKALEQEVAAERAAANSGGSFPNMAELLALLEKSKLQREQFSTDGKTADAVRRAFEVVNFEKKRVAPAESKVEDAIKCYQQAQDAIKTCHDEGKLHALRAARDAACKELQEQLQAFKSGVDDTETQSRLERLRVSLADLRRVYGKVLDVPGVVSLESASARPTLRELLTNFGILKMEKRLDFEKARWATDSARSRLTACLQDVLKMLDKSSASNIPQKLEICKVSAGVMLNGGGEEPSFDSPEEFSAKKGSFACLEIAARHLLNCVRTEVSTCDLLSTASREVLVALVRRTAEELQRMIDQAAGASAVHDRFRGLLQDLSLDGPPCDSAHAERLAEELGQLRSAVRKLKSTLRHRVADLEDIESSDEAEVAKVQEEVEALRASLHAVLIKEEGLLSQLSDLQSHHFPELAVMYPSLELPLHQRYDGLLKPHWELALFHTVRCGGLLKTTLLQKDHWLIEYALDGPDCLEALMTKICKYSPYRHPRLLPIRAVFVSKDQRHAYLMVPGRGLPLVGGKRAVLACWQLLLQVLQALHYLHTAAAGDKPALVHGRVHPASVLVSDDGRSAWLSLFDFNAYSLVKGYMLPPADQVDFVAPELRNYSSPPTTSSDMFAFGCLMLWLLFPGTVFTQGTLVSLGSATPDVQYCDRKELQLIRRLVEKEPHRRLTAAELLADPTFKWCVEMQHPAKPMCTEPAQQSPTIAVATSKPASSETMPKEPPASKAAPEEPIVSDKM